MLSYARLLALSAALLLAAAPQSKSPAPPAPPVKPSMPAVAPITFADPDGQELILEELSARTAVHGMLSLTELELRFRNPQPRRIEGRFTCTLPPNAAISRFAKEIGGQLMEGEVVERLRANQVYEQFLHQMRDPALLEQDQGNRFSARIFPIEANAPVRLLVSYTQLLPMKAGMRTYTLPLRGLSKVNKLTFRGFVTPVPGEESAGKMTTSTAEVTRFDERDWTPDRDITLSWRAGDDAPRGRVLRAGDFYLAAFRPDVHAAATQSSGKWVFYVDTSASSAEGATHRIRALQELLEALPAQDRVQLIAFDQDLAPLASGSASDVARRAGDLLRTRLFLGGTDVAALIADIARELREDSTQTIVVASDLVPTVGNTAPNEISDAIAALPKRATIHGLILGSRENASTARALTAGHGRIVRVPFTEALDARAREAATELRRPPGATFAISDPSSEWVYPSKIEDVAGGDEIIVLGKLKPGREPQLSLGGAQPTPLNASTFGPLLEREAYRAYLDYLAEREANEPSEAVRRALAAEQVRISVEQRVVTSRTTMLVLESEWDYQRFGLDRRALAAILTIDAGGIGRIDRRNEMIARPVEPVPPPPRPLPRPMPAAKAAPAPPTEALAVPSDVAAESARPNGLEQTNGLAFEAIQEIPRLTTSVAAADEVAPMRVEQPRARSERRDEEKRPDADWTKRALPPRSRIAELEAKLRDDARDRGVYNQLSETLAAYGEWSSLRRLALRWQPYDPENPQVYEVLGLADEHLGNEDEAARAYASLIEIAPAKPELLQRAGLLLLATRHARVAEAPLRRALELRPDRANAYRHLAIMLWSEGRLAEAARVLESATAQQFPNWYGGVDRVIREELGYVYRAWMKKEPSRRDEIADRAREFNVNLERHDGLRVTLAWETDANDVDLHVVDPDGEECFYNHRSTRSGLELYEDITQGLGPEVVRTNETERGTYHIGVRYFAAGPMGISRGVVVVLTGGDQIAIHPFRLTEEGGDIRYVTAVKM